MASFFNRKKNQDHVSEKENTDGPPANTDVPTLNPDAPVLNPDAPILRCEDLGYRTDDLTIIQGLNLSINRGERVALAGPSGSGKSTIMRLMANLISPSSGNIYFQGVNINEISPMEYRREVSYFFQTAQLFGRTVQDNLAFPYEIRHLDFDRKRAVELLTRCGLNEDYLEQTVGTLSGGERQRVALVRNLQFIPQVLLLDEITSALDQENREIIWKFIDELAVENQLTIVMVSHLEEDIALAERVIDIHPPRR